MIEQRRVHAPFIGATPGALRRRSGAAMGARGRRPAGKTLSMVCCCLRTLPTRQLGSAIGATPVLDAHQNRTRLRSNECILQVRRGEGLECALLPIGHCVGWSTAADKAQGHGIANAANTTAIRWAGTRLPSDHGLFAGLGRHDLLRTSAAGAIERCRPFDRQAKIRSGVGSNPAATAARLQGSW
jgi:hypothetical protein